MWGPGVPLWLRRCATSRTVPGSIPGGVTWDFFRGSFRQNHVPWGRLSLWKWVPGISPGVKAAGAFGWRPTTLVVPKFDNIRGLNLPGTPWATSACRGMTFTYLHINCKLRYSSCKPLWNLQLQKSNLLFLYFNCNMNFKIAHCVNITW